MSIYDEIKTERTKQDIEWGGPDHDDTHPIADWVRFIQHHARKSLRTTDVHVRRYALVRVAALAVAAIESLDRASARLATPDER